MKRGLLTLAVFLCCCVNAVAQFYSYGDDPGKLKWKEIRTDKYRVIYPAGADSLALEYAKSLEKWSAAVGKTSGFIPNQNYRKPHPVVLHTQTAHGNGMVAWTPRRTELLTTPDAYCGLPQSWMDQLVVHESRHVSQMQYVNGRPYKVFTVLTGQLFAGALAAIYAGPYFFEGDAVCAETEMSKAGRGRNASFLEYYKVSLQEGKNRNWWQWLYGSQNRYTPNHYAAGYVAISGMRSVYGAQNFTEQYFEPLTHGWPFPFFQWQRTIKKVSGKRLPEAFREITDSLKAEWDRMDAGRGEFTTGTRVTENTRLFSEFTELEDFCGKLYGIREGLDRTRELVRVGEDGKIGKIRQFASQAGHLSHNSNRLFWSETITDKRWTLRSYSEIHCLDTDGKVHRLTKHSRYYNPCANGDKLSVTEYMTTGGSAVAVLDASDGKVLCRIVAPDSLEIRESALLDGRLYVSAVGVDGIGIYLADEGFLPVLAASHHSLQDFHFHDHLLYFTSDCDGTNELYSLNPSNGATCRVTSFKQGAKEFCRIGDALYYTCLEPDGRQVWKSELNDIEPVPVDFSSGYRHKVAEKLSEAAEEPLANAGTIKGPTDYSKLAHLLHLHSWIPAYLNPNAVSTLSFENLATDLGVGATVFFQNELGTMSGSLGYAGWTKESGWRNSLHAKFTYSGLYPVIEAGIDFNNRFARHYLPYSRPVGHEMASSLTILSSSTPSVEATLKAYIPWKFNSGGWLRGVIPQLSLNLSNDSYSNGVSVDKAMLYGTASLRGYSMLPVAPSGIYPRWGIGAELGANAYLVPSGAVSPAHYAYLYGYLPGILRTHGIKITALMQKHAGLGGSFSASYALPFAPVDWSFLSPVAYIRNFEFVGQLGWSGNSTGGKANVYTSLSARLANFFWVPYATRIGVYYSQAFAERPSIGLVFSISQ